MTTITADTAIIPTAPSALYDEAGIDFLQTRDGRDGEADPVEWVQVGAFTEDGIDWDLVHDAIRERGYRITSEDTTHDGGTDRYVTVALEAL
jgi:hypothetical protein